MPQTPYTCRLDHYTLLVKSSDVDPSEKSAVVINLRIISPTRAISEVQIPSPFVSDGRGEATLETGSIRAVVNNREATPRQPIPADLPWVAFFVGGRFLAGETYEVFTVAHYSNFRPYAPPTKHIALGIEVVSEDRFRATFEPTSDTASLQIDMLLLDSRLSEPPFVLVIDSELKKDGEACGVQPFRLSPVNNHFSWEMRNVSPGARFEIDWAMPPPDHIIERLLQQPTDSFVESFNLLRSFVRKALLLEPGTVKEEYQELKATLASASKKLVLIDPFIDRRLIELLSNVREGIRVIIVTSPGKDADAGGSEILEFAKQKRWDITLKGSPSVHDRFVIIDDKRLLMSGASFKDLYRRASLLTTFEAGHTVTLDIIRALYKVCGI